MPCRICTANDLDAFADEIAGGLWEASREADYREVAWPDAPDMWRRAYTRHATVLIEVARGKGFHG